MRVRFITSIFGVLFCFLVFSFSAYAQGTLDKIRKNGALRCGVNTGLAGFSAPNDKGELVGFDIDYCKAIAAAVFGDSRKVTYKPISGKQRFSALQSGELDVLVRNTTWTISRDTKGMNFRAINYYDGQGFMIRASLKLSSVMDLDGASICLQAGTTSELNLSDYFRMMGMNHTSVVLEQVEEVNAAYDSGRCDAYSGDLSAMYSARLVLSDPDAHVILPEIISKEPLGPVVREGDDQWFDIVSWVHYVLLESEELGITQANVNQMKGTKNVRIRRLLGLEKRGMIGTDLGLDNDWVINIVSAVGNYSEIFERNLGQGSRLGIARGQNALWSDGGLQYPIPIR
ncbi:MAG: amino acid ABC transporter substrate-binding protein [Alphaproteobacteria bacterium]|nr:amino acid ABC transporter substrate-binding protein [Alphaproteobacteria bacterium]